MAVSTYAELQTAVSNEIRRDDLTDRIPEFISRCESRLNRKLRLREMQVEVEVTYSASATDRFIDVPAGYIEYLDLKIKKATQERKDYQKMTYVAPDLIHRYSGQFYYGYGYPYNSYYDESYMHFTLRDKFELSREVNEDHDVKIHYIKRWDLETDNTNWLLTNHHDVYLYGSVLQAEAYTKNDERLQIWKIAFDEAMQELNEVAERGRDDAVLDPIEYNASRDGRYYNIITGY